MENDTKFQTLYYPNKLSYYAGATAAVGVSRGGT